MPDEAVVAAPSAAEPTALPRSGSPEYAAWRSTGEIPSSEAKTVESPATDTPKEETAVLPDPAAGKQQESRRKPDAEARIAELTAKTRQLEKDLEDARKPKEAKADPPPARQPEVNAKPKPEDKNADGTPKYAAYEDYVEALADYKAEQRMATREREQADAQRLQSTTQKLNEARTRYEDYDSKAMPVVQELLKEGVSREVFSVLNDSPVLADLLYAIGGDDKISAAFLKDCRENPGKALRVALIMEQAIVKELEGGKPSAERNEQGQFVAKPVIETPVKRGPESAPKPPLEIGNRGGGESSDTETGNFRAWMEAENAKDARARRGA